MVPDFCIFARIHRFIKKTIINIHKNHLAKKQLVTIMLGDARVQ